MPAYKGKILVVDDDPQLLPMLIDTLDAIGYETVAATDGVEALTCLEQIGADQFDLMITDVKMPRMDGISLLRRIRLHYPRLPVLFVSGYASDEMITAASPDGHLIKPFRIDRLEELIEDTLSNKYKNRRPTALRKVLISSRQESLRNMLSDTLSAGNYLPFAVNSGNEAIEELNRGDFDLFVTSPEDLTDDEESAESIIRNNYPKLPMIAVIPTNNSDTINRLSAKVRFNHIINLPIDNNELLNLLENTFTIEPDDQN